MKYTIRATDNNPENNITIECKDQEDMDKYTLACTNQGYLVKTEVTD